MENNKGPQNGNATMGEVVDAHLNNKHGRELFLFAMFFVFVFFIYITFLHPHSSPDYIKEIKAAIPAAANPPVPTTATATPTPTPAPTEVAAVVAAGETQGPWVSTPESIAKGQAIFKTNCTICHGDKGLGDGPAGQALNPKPRNFGEGKWKQGNSTIDIFNTVSNGIPGTSMAGYKGIIASEEDRWAIAHFVKSISKNIVDPTPSQIKAFKEKKK